MKKREQSLRVSLFSLVLAFAALVLAGPTSYADIFYSYGNMSFSNGISGNGDYVVGADPTLAYRWHFGTSTIDNLGTLGSDTVSSANKISYDGSVVTGTSGSGSSRSAFRWEEGVGPMVDIGDRGSGAAAGYAINADGTLIAGQEGISPSQAFLWEQGATPEMTTLGYLPSGSTSGQARAMSGDGSVIVGQSHNGTSTEAFVKLAGSPMYGLGFLAGGTTSIAYGVSPDGVAVVGQSGSGSGPQAFYYKDLDGGNDFDAGEMIGLGDLLGGSFNSSAKDVAIIYNPTLGRDMTIIVGYGNTDPCATKLGDTGKRAVAWVDDVTQGVFAIYDVAYELTTRFGVDLTDWVLTEVTGISDDGMTITGNGMHTVAIETSNGDLGALNSVMVRPEAWVVRIPEPATWAIILLGSSALLRRRKA
ncbi:MAG: PEP-CTERM sorting domain-containing protein [Sedimentisphaerales bacterium]|nr:PEP-CTERM sorting domain-containing protein [Sedimentisphaerales bacterium]